MIRKALHWLRCRPFLCLLVLIAPILALAAWTQPPAMPSYADTRGQWRASEAWLRDRHGQLIETIRVDFAVRRLAGAHLSHAA